MAELERRLAELPDRMQATWARDLERLQRSLTGHLHALEARIDGALNELGVGSPTPTPPRSPGSQPPLTGEFYAALEERFRGSTADIRARQAGYLEDIDALPTKGPVLDLGCGRGEFLEDLRQHGIDAVGIDSSEVAVTACVAAGLEARRGDLLQELRAWPDASVKAVSLLQVAEHLPFETLFEVLREAHRVIGPGGLLLVETPNGANLSVAASTFWLDPTHVRPIHPLLLQFVAEQAGFTDAVLRGSSSMAPPWRLGEGQATSPESVAITALQSLVLDDQDVTLLAHVAD